MAAVHGMNSYLSFAGTNLSTWFNDVTWSDEADTAEVTVFTQGDKTYVAGPKDHSFSASGVWDGAAAAVDEVLSPLEGTVGALIYGPNGNTVGRVRKTAQAIFTKYEVTGSTGDAVQTSGEWQITGAVTRDTF